MQIDIIGMHYMYSATNLDCLPAVLKTEEEEEMLLRESYDLIDSSDGS
jgi:hypothetical protein